MRFAHIEGPKGWSGEHTERSAVRSHGTPRRRKAWAVRRQAVGQIRWQTEGLSTRITRSLANQRFAASDRDGNAFLPQMQAFALQKMPEMTYTPSFLI